MEGRVVGDASMDSQVGREDGEDGVRVVGVGSLGTVKGPGAAPGSIVVKLQPCSRLYPRPHLK